MLGIDKISSKIASIDCKEVAKLFQLDSKVVNRPNIGEIDMLIGLQQFAYHPVKIREAGHLLLMKNQFGLVIAGSHQDVEETIIKESCSLVRQATVMHLQESMNRFHSVEGLGVVCTPQCGSCQCGKCHPGGKDMTLKDEGEFQQIEAGLKFDEKGGNWLAAYPWIRSPTELPNNRKFAIKMMLATKRMLQRDSKKADVFKQQMEDLLRRGVARVVTEEEFDGYAGPRYYINYHGVMNPSSTSTPFRIVFNSSAKYCGSSLNEFLAKGPSLLNSLLGILLRWRQNQFGYVGDI